MSDEKFDDQAFLDALDELEKIGQGEGGLFGRFQFRIGWFAYTGELEDVEDKFASFVPTDADDRQKALESINDTLEESGIEKTQALGPHISYVLRFPKSTAKGVTAERAEGWSVSERVLAVPIWSDAAKELIRPQIKEIGLKLGWHWGRITFAPDPSGRTETGLDGEERVKLVAYPAELYASETECEEAASGGNSESEASDSISSKYQADIKSDFAKLVEDGMKPKKAAREVAEDWEEDFDDVWALVK